MRKNKGKLGVLLFGIVGIVNTSHAALNDLGNGLVNDTTLDIIWMKDANLVKTSCDANNALWQAFDPAALPVDEQSGHSKTQICTANGKLNWFEAESWVKVLNTQYYLGYNDWRQPLTVQPDASCESLYNEARGGFTEQRGGYNCTGSELGHLFNISLVNPNQAGTGATGGTVGTSCFGTERHCLKNTMPFDNVQSFSYWSGSEFAPDPTFAWAFIFDLGIQGGGFKVESIYVWPVHSGQSVVAPVIPQDVPSLSIWGLGIMTLLLAFVARRKVI